MILDCKHVWREVSAYLDGDLDPDLRRDLEAHLATCRHSAALVDSTRNVLVLVADERTFRLPEGFSSRLRQKLARELGP